MLLFWGVLNASKNCDGSIKVAPSKKNLKKNPCGATPTN
jgi:hypothetical protein